MEIAEAKQILGLNDNFTQMELISAYKNNIAENDSAEADIDELGTFSESANKLYDISRAYLLLRDKELEIVPELAAQPLIIFTDASVKKNIDVAAFGVVADNIPRDFNFPSSIIEKYNITSFHIPSNQHHCIFSGLVANYDVNSAEMMAILCSIEVFMYLTQLTDQTMVIYTDSLVAKKVLSDKRMPPNTKLYTALRKRFRQLKDTHQLDIIIKKVNAHVGIELNEIADATAKIRLERMY